MLLLWFDNKLIRAILSGSHSLIGFSGHLLDFSKRARVPHLMQALAVDLSLAVLRGAGVLNAWAERRLRAPPAA
jgi:hypothetical protein